MTYHLLYACFYVLGCLLERTHNIVLEARDGVSELVDALGGERLGRSLSGLDDLLVQRLDLLRRLLRVGADLDYGAVTSDLSLLQSLVGRDADGASGLVERTGWT